MSATRKWHTLIMGNQRISSHISSRHRIIAIGTALAAIALPLTACSSSATSTTATASASAEASVERNAADRSGRDIYRLCVTNASGHASVGFSFTDGLLGDDLQPLTRQTGELARNATVCASTTNIKFENNAPLTVALRIPGETEAGILNLNSDNYGARSIATLNRSVSSYLDPGQSHYIESGAYRLDMKQETAVKSTSLNDVRTWSATLL